MKYILTVCGRRVELDLPVELNTDNKSAEYIRPISECEAPCEFHAVYSVREKLQDTSGGQLLAGEYLYLPLENGIRCARVSFKTNRPYVCTDWNYKEKRAEICIIPEYAVCLSAPGNIRNYLRMDILLYLMGAFTLHASLIEHDGCMIAFSAPSGTGKSTQAALWEKHIGSTIINGDNAGIIKSGGVWYGCGFPYSGSSGISVNRVAPLRAVVCLKQGKQNELRRMSLSESVRFLYPQQLIQRTDARIVQSSVELLTALAADVPVYELSCLPDKTAAELLYNTIFNKKE